MHVPLCRLLSISRNSLLMKTRSQTALLSNYAVKHNESANQFYMTVGSEVATVDYVKNGNVLDLTHSYVPESLRGQRLGHVLAKGTFDQLAARNQKIKITCSFLQRVYEENKNKYGHLLAE